MPRHCSEKMLSIFFKTLANMVAVVKVEKPQNRLANVRAKALVDLLANTLLEIEM